MHNRFGFLASVVTVCLATGSLVAPCSAASEKARTADVTAVSKDTYRTGWDPDEPGLAPGQVSSSDFGQRFSTAVDGQVYAQPLVVGNTVVVATENNKVYGLDSATGVVIWTKSLGAA
ncbi:outer membrane protein assembly factor BamB family protein [Streptomyces sp. NBC_00582]|uniref:outer membrane protein assembly factor BamB family protein n=1 Tax=Streptomyces sp. NBC_00582 TaxID=2975783 RepID=UPI002E80D447|nr:PQQ-binding-like beta-propeller repeat protein [Streptomyces sp. NBC_00582]WUB67380.1 PQQ-binding-like beta-propeller repeat protein [Streptomyces sp. NBC_00582]